MAIAAVCEITPPKTNAVRGFRIYRNQQWRCWPHYHAILRWVDAMDVRLCMDIVGESIALLR